MKNDVFVIGIDYGTDSVRSIIVNANDGTEVASSVFEYPRWKDGLYCDPAENQFRQHPKCYVEGVENTVKQFLQQAGSVLPANIRAISVDTTGSTPVAVDETGTPLSLICNLEESVIGVFVLWVVCQCVGGVV